MKTISVICASALLFLSASAAPTDIPAPAGGWEAIDYPKGTGENLKQYSAPKGGWETLNYGWGKGKDKGCDGLWKFTSTYHVKATPDQVVNGTTPTGGLKGAVGYYDFGINSDLNLICWKIKLIGFRGEYQSPAKTATHVHEAAKGESGPPRLAFPNPVGSGNERYSYGCMTGPFTTGILANGTDTGAGFKVKQIEANPSGFFADVHSSLAVPGAVRGQLS